MIFKKPYAFLIKNFKLIHVLLSVIIIFIINRFGKITGFFLDYVKGNIRNAAGLSSSYIGSLIYLAIFIVVIFALIMFLLMKNKKKPTLFYILLFSYYLLLLILTSVAGGVLNSLEEITLTQQSSRAYRDIYMILALPQYYFIIMSIIRGIGFDVKKFNFSKDLAELEIKSEDNEEFEFVLGTDTYKYKRKIRRTFREVKYYVLENKFIFTIVFGVVGTVALIGLVLNFNFFNKVYKVGSSGNIGSFTYKLTSAYETKYDYNGNLINAEKKYIVLNMVITNKSYKPLALDNIYLYLKSGENSVYHEPSLRNYFIDIGKSYINEELPPDQEKNVIFIFEIDEKTNFKKYYLNILKNIDYKEGQAIYNYAKFKIKPTTLIDKPSNVDRQVNEVMYLGENIFDSSNIIFTKAELSNSYEYKYESCVENICNQYFDVISPTDPTTESLLVLNYKLDVSKNIGLSESMNSDKYFFDKFLKVEYYYNNKRVIKNLNTSTPKQLQGMVFVDIPKNSLNSDVLNLLISSRNNTYIINLKDIK